MNPQGDVGQASTHIQEAMKLEADGYAHLFTITMFPVGEPEVIIAINPHRTVTWNGYTWNRVECHLADYKKESSGEVSRPKFSVVNPEALFSGYIHRGWMDNAEIVRYRVLTQHLDSNVNSFLKNTWRVGRVASLNKNVVIFELREAMDGQFFILPGRAFYPPEFPSVSV